MASVIDALVVTLGLDSSAFKKGQQEATDSTRKFSEDQEASAKKVAAQAKAMSEGFRRVRNELLGLFAVAIGATGFKSFIESQVKGQAQMAYTAKNLNMTARELDAWGKTVKTVGGTAEGFQSSLQSIASGIEAFKLGEDSPVVSMFRSIGVNIGDATGKIRPFKEMLLDVSDVLQKYDAQDQIRIAQGLGIDNDTLNLLRQGRGAVQNLYDQMLKASGVTEESTKRAQEAQKVWGEFTGEMSGVGQSVFEALVPAIIEATKGLKDFGKWVNDNRGEIGDFFRGLVDDGERLAKIFGNGSDGGAIAGVSSMTAALVGLGAALLTIGSAGPGAIASLARLSVIGAAGYAGYRLGEKINDLLPEDTKDSIGSGIAHTLAFFGNEEAITSTGINDLTENKDKADYVTKFFMEKGWSKEQAAGIAANLSAESNFNPSAYGDGLRAYGVAQWHSDRQQEFQKQFGKSIHGSSLEDQLSFVHYELTQGNERPAGDALRSAKTAKDAGEIVSRKYERPANADFDATRRGQLASMISGSNGLLPVGATANKEVAAGATVVNNTNSSEVHIGQLTVQTQATDANGVANGMSEALKQNSLINSAAQGMH